MILVRESRPVRRRRRNGRRGFLVGTALVLFAGIALAVMSPQWRDAYSVLQSDTAPLAELPSIAAAGYEGDRLVYPFSIISGGAHSPSELKAAIDADPVVRTHFANFDLTRTQVVRLDAPRLAHVSYRVGNSVYWTRKTVVLAAGEQVLTDGQHIARTRCGNQVAEVPGNVSADEPAPAVLDTPVSTLRPGPFAGVTLPPLGPVVGGSGNPPSPVGATGGGGGPFPGGSRIGGGGGVPVGGGQTATPTGNPSLQPSAGDNPTAGTHEDPVPDAPGGGSHGGAGGPGNPNFPSNPLPPPDVIPGLQPPPGGQPPPTFGPPPGNPPGDTPPGHDVPPGFPPPDGPPHTGVPPSDPQTPTIPEPSTIVLAGVSAGAWLARRRRAI